jgi:hypothetical protein
MELSPLLSSLVPAVPAIVSSTLVMPNGTFVKGWFCPTPISVIGKNIEKALFVMAAKKG